MKRVFVFFFVFVFFVSCGRNNPETAGGKPVDFPEMEYGASVATFGEYGISFSAFIPREYIDFYESRGFTVSFGMAIIPAEYVYEYGGITSENLFGENAVYGKAAFSRFVLFGLTPVSKDEGYIVKGFLAGLEENDVKRKFIGRGFAIIGGKHCETFRYYDGDEASRV